ncbi:P-loop containing nucleoside triphosphate hydrolase protein [Roridomyces roridus]|uniref:P-loop containing nucleoside triphosphate hydrolase protein n=1 Tax=Roridomyces roridus TaxID=1738132 RepID=A0AAD7BIS6_9AGAR|nr:P-loop containing nucleoside triphosphate hydrolase protein [Roridomyces roridus]
MGAVFSAIGEAVLSLFGAIRAGPAGENPTHAAIEAESRAQAAREEAERLRQEAEVSTQRAQAAMEAMEAAQAEAERIRAIAEEEQREAQRREQEMQEEARKAVEAAREEASRQQQLAEEVNRRAMESQRVAEGAARAAAQEAQAARESAQAEQEEGQRREQEMREEARKAVEAAQEAALQQQQIAQEESRRAMESLQAAQKAARIAAEEARVAVEAKEEMARQLREGIQPVVMPTIAEFDEAKRRIQYRDGIYHFAIAGTAGSGKSSLINALRGLKSKDSGAAKTGIVETTLTVGRFPDADPKNPIVWYDIPGAGTFNVPDWQYFNDQGLYVFDALIVLIDNRFTKTDIAILRNARLFQIPCYIVRSKADVHIRNVMLEMGFDSDDEDQDEETREDIEEAARENFIGGTRLNVAHNLRDADLPTQRVYIVSNSTMLSATRRNITRKAAKRMVDELEFLRDLLKDALKRRGVAEKAKGLSSLLKF